MGVEAVIATQVIDTTSVGRSVMTAANAAAALSALGAQPTLVSGTNIKTINSTSILGSGNIAVSASPAGSSGEAQYNNDGAFGGMTAVVYAGSSTHVTITAQAAATVPLRIVGAASQTGALTSWDTPSNANNNGYALQVLPAASSLNGYNGQLRLGRNASIVIDSSQYANTPAICSSTTANGAGMWFSGDNVYYGAGAAMFTFGLTGVTLANGYNFICGTSTGTKIGTGTTQKIGFWNATPVVQQVLATGAGRTVDDVITMLQTLGLCKQS